ncbi:MFS transporter [Halalkalibacter okhensis]|uniref:Major facilitator superfamily (MFS) profile domain-containing protein n=1 Tax=Halalkalibacter okhensis TaxID=333138 RepID=A0A0B0IAE7_9BACI|nr:MFS transporter [Halalkalibacter okhensis]KHF37802.1 hypothetical protein LQ50_25255 [Halalkalibacter okhensis]
MLKNRKFMSIFSGQTISNFGEQFYLIAIPFLVYEMSQSTLTMGTVSAIIAFPQIIFGLLIGVLIDRFSKRKIMIYSTLLQVILMTLLPVLYVSGTIHIYHVYIIVFLYALGSLTFLSTYRSSLPQLVEPDHLVKANALIQSSLTIIRVVGPLLAGLIIAYFGLQNAFYINLLSFCLILLILVLVNFPEETVNNMVKKPESFSEQLKEGVAFIFQNKTFLKVNILFFFVNIGMSMGLSLMVFYLHGVYLLSEDQVGYVYAISGGIAFLLSIFSPLITKRVNILQSIVASCGLAGVSLVFMAFPFHWIIMGAILGGIMGSATVANIFINSYFQQETPKHLIGRVFTTSQMFTRISTPLAVFVGGWFTHYFVDIKVLFLISGLLIILTTVAVSLFVSENKKDIKKVALNHEK